MFYSYILVIGEKAQGREIERTENRNWLCSKWTNQFLHEYIKSYIVKLVINL